MTEEKFSGLGSGTEADPYQITNVQQLQEIKYDLEGHYVLMNDIDCSEFASEFRHNFDGVFDGRNFKFYNYPVKKELFIGIRGIIKNLTINGYYAGADSILCSLNLGHLHGINLDFKEYNGNIGYGCICTSNEGIIERCDVRGNITKGLSNIGGICAFNRRDGIIEDCSFKGKIEGYKRIGYIFSENKGKVINCKGSGGLEYTSKMERLKLWFRQIIGFSAVIISNIILVLFGIYGIGGYNPFPLELVSNYWAFAFSIPAITLGAFLYAAIKVSVDDKLSVWDIVRGTYGYLTLSILALLIFLTFSTSIFGITNIIGEWLFDQSLEAIALYWVLTTFGLWMLGNIIIVVAEIIHLIKFKKLDGFYSDEIEFIKWRQHKVIDRPRDFENSKIALFWGWFPAIFFLLVFITMNIFHLKSSRFYYEGPWLEAKVSKYSNYSHLIDTLGNEYISIPQSKMNIKYKYFLVKNYRSIYDGNNKYFEGSFIRTINGYLRDHDDNMNEFEEVLLSESKIAVKSIQYGLKMQDSVILEPDNGLLKSPPYSNFNKIYIKKVYPFGIGGYTYIDESGRRLLEKGFVDLSFFCESKALVREDFETDSVSIINNMKPLKN